MWTFLALFGLSMVITLPIILCFRAKNRKSDPPVAVSTAVAAAPPPPKGGYKPGHLPEFADPDQKETNTFYEVQSCIAFPVKEENGKPRSQSQQHRPATPPSVAQPLVRTSAMGGLTTNGESMLATTEAKTATGNVKSKQ